jgi:hypothetical protein
MRPIARIRSALLVPVILAVPAVSSAQSAVFITIGPPELPVYEQPALPDAGYLWTPGYWDYGPDGYFWVPGTWVQAPAPGLLWTPGYWSWGNGGYAWNRGYWDTQVGYYGAINYGYGYSGHGYEGGYWSNGALYYNRSVNNISTTTNITNVYTKTVLNNTTVTNVSYSGGSGGTTGRPTAEELTISGKHHTPPTAEQTQHAQAASTNHAQFASVNHGQPAIVATPKPGVFTGNGVVTASRVAVQYRAVSTGDVATKKVATPPKMASPPDSKPQPESKPKPAPDEKPKPETPPSR